MVEVVAVAIIFRESLYLGEQSNNHPPRLKVFACLVKCLKSKTELIPLGLRITPFRCKP